MASRFFLSLFMFGAHVHAQSYAPNTSVQCPNGWLVEPADGLPQREEAYRTSRKAIADANLATWLENTNVRNILEQRKYLSLRSFGDFIVLYFLEHSTPCSGAVVNPCSS